MVIQTIPIAIKPGFSKAWFRSIFMPIVATKIYIKILPNLLAPAPS